MKKVCGTCKHWQGDETTYMASCALNLAFAARVPFDEPADDCDMHDDGKPKAPVGGPAVNYWGHYWGWGPKP